MWTSVSSVCKQYIFKAFHVFMLQGLQPMGGPAVDPDQVTTVAAAESRGAATRRHAHRAPAWESPRPSRRDVESPQPPPYTHRPSRWAPCRGREKVTRSSQGIRRTFCYHYKHLLHHNDPRLTARPSQESMSALLTKKRENTEISHDHNKHGWVGGDLLIFSHICSPRGPTKRTCQCHCPKNVKN